MTHVFHHLCYERYCDHSQKHVQYHIIHVPSNLSQTTQRKVSQISQMKRILSPLVSVIEALDSMTDFKN